MRLNAVITQHEVGFVAQCLGVDVVAQGETAAEATANLRAALALADMAHIPPAEPTVLTTIDVPTQASAASPRGVTRTEFLERAEINGWSVERRGSTDFLRAPNGSVVALPGGANLIAPGVVRLVGGSSGTGPAQAAAVLGRLDELFARHPHTDDTTQLVREQRDDA